MRFKYSIRDIGEGILEKIGSQSENIINWKNWLQEYDFFPEYPDDPYAWLTDVLALKSVNSGNYGVGSILVGVGGEIAAMGHNLVYSPYFRSDLHAEMVTVNYFEKENPQITTLKEYALYTSLESCPMCLVRLISAGINRVVYVSSDPIGGMVNAISLLPPSGRIFRHHRLLKRHAVPESFQMLQPRLCLSTQMNCLKS